MCQGSWPEVSHEVWCISNGACLSRTTRFELFLIMASLQLLLLLTLLVCSACGAGLDDKKGQLEDKLLEVQEATPVPYAIFQFISTAEGVSSYLVSGETEGKINISTDGWLYLSEALEWSPGKKHTLSIGALSADGETVDGPCTVVLHVVDVNNNPPIFDQVQYSGTIREHSPAGSSIVRVFATDADDPDTPNSQLSYSIESQIPNPTGVAFFTIDPNTGEISTTEEGAASLRARPGVRYSRGEARGSVDVLKKKFDEFCLPKNEIPVENNPFFTCVQRVESRQLNVMQDPDYTLIVRVEDLGGGAPTALSSITRVNIAVTQNLWISPGLLPIMENLKTDYPMLLTTVRANDPNALYRLVQKEREVPFPFTIDEDGNIFVTEPLDRETKDGYTLVVLAVDEQGVELESPMEIHVEVGDVNDNPPECTEAEMVLEVQENEKIGSRVGDLKVHDADEQRNSLLVYSILSQSPTNPSDGMFFIDETRGTIQVANHNFRRKDVPKYHLKVSVTDGAHSTVCNVVINIIDLNNEIPIFEKNDYGRYSVPELAEIGDTLLTIKATDADDPGTGSSKVDYHITAGDPDNVFAIEVDDATGEGRIYIARPLDYETQSTYNLQIDARNPEPLIEGVNYDDRSTAVVAIELVDVDEPPVFTLDIMNVNIPENVTVGTTILTADAKDPEGHKIMFKLEGDEHGWLDLNAETGELKTKATMDREVVDQLTVRIIAYESEGQMQQTEREVSIQLMDVNDNYPKLQRSRGFICVKKPEPLILTAVDGDAEPFGEPFTFTLQLTNRKSQNWALVSVNGTSAKLTLKKKPTSDQTISIPVNIKDNAGMGITQKIDVRVCNCTQMGYCFIAPESPAWKFSLSTTVGILGGVLGFIVLLLGFFICRTKKKGKKETTTADGETNAML
ncbi:cadherin-17 [Neoarius graeffei]|uniref:cadherin-17 n=1 Tax=Neoarius graeffei TaxID=443677 RepID=UPI00298D026E|nr:cadherin-17 [Neoarius graeffei]